jgi:hypothetical protein
MLWNFSTTNIPPTHLIFWLRPLYGTGHICDVSKKKILEIFLNRSKNPKNYFHAKPFGKSFNHIGNRPFFKFQSQKGKIDKIIDTTLHFRTKTSDFFFFFHQLKRQYCFPCQTLWKIIYSYWEEAIFQVSEPESKN